MLIYSRRALKELNSFGGDGFWNFLFMGGGSKYTCK